MWTSRDASFNNACPKSRGFATGIIFQHLSFVQMKRKDLIYIYKIVQHKSYNLLLPIGYFYTQRQTLIGYIHKIKACYHYKSSRKSVQNVFSSNRFQWLSFRGQSNGVRFLFSPVKVKRGTVSSVQSFRVCCAFNALGPYLCLCSIRFSRGRSITPSEPHVC